MFMEIRINMKLLLFRVDECLFAELVRWKCFEDSVERYIFSRDLREHQHTVVNMGLKGSINQVHG